MASTHVPAFFFPKGFLSLVFVTGWYTKHLGIYISVALISRQIGYTNISNMYRIMNIVIETWIYV